DLTCRLAGLTGALWRALPLIALHGADHALAIRRDATVLDIARPGIDHLSRGIDVLGVAGTERDRIAAMKILRAFVAVRPAAGGEGRNRESCESTNDLEHVGPSTHRGFELGSSGIMWP